MGEIYNKKEYWGTNIYDQKVGEENKINNECEDEVSKIEDSILKKREEILEFQKQIRKLEKEAESKVDKIWIK